MLRTILGITVAVQRDSVNADDDPERVRVPFDGCCRPAAPPDESG
jgi:hypothetical protein